MAEVKRTAHKGKMNRDLDDRLVPDGEYRLGVNVNIGRSDGSDVGAVENLQGNTLQDVANDPLLQNSEVIGQVKDPNSDKIYYFTTSDSIDANGLENGVDQIREFDAATGNIKTILTDTKAPNRDGSLPTCLPLITTDITLPDGVLAIPPGFPAFHRNLFLDVRILLQLTLILMLHSTITVVSLDLDVLMLDLPLR